MVLSPLPISSKTLSKLGEEWVIIKGEKWHWLWPSFVQFLKCDMTYPSCGQVRHVSMPTHQTGPDLRLRPSPNTNNLRSEPRPNGPWEPLINTPGPAHVQTSSGYYNYQFHQSSSGYYSNWTEIIEQDRDSDPEQIGFQSMDPNGGYRVIGSKSQRLLSRESGLLHKKEAKSEPSYP